MVLITKYSARCFIFLLLFVTILSVLCPHGTHLGAIQLTIAIANPIFENYYLLSVLFVDSHSLIQPSQTSSAVHILNACMPFIDMISHIIFSCKCFLLSVTNYGKNASNIQVRVKKSDIVTNI